MTWTEQRPWGRFKNLLESECTKVKLIEVDPGKRLSYQSHQHRDESWTIVQGRAEVTIDDETFILSTGEHVSIKSGQKHRIRNSSTILLQFIEVQTGRSFEEEDIRRFDDDFGRA